MLRFLKTFSTCLNRQQLTLQ